LQQRREIREKVLAAYVLRADYEGIDIGSWETKRVSV
jgi:hypothetical protein